MRLNNKTVLRAGYGFFFARYVSGLISTLYTSNGIYTQSLSINSPTSAGAPVFPNVLASAAGATGSEHSDPGGSGHAQPVHAADQPQHRTFVHALHRH